MQKTFSLLVLFIALSLSTRAQLETHKWKLDWKPVVSEKSKDGATYEMYGFLPMKIENNTAVFPAATLSFNKQKGLCYIESELGKTEGQYFMPDDNHITLIFKDVKYPFTIVHESEHKIYLSGNLGRIILHGVH